MTNYREGGMNVAIITGTTQGIGNKLVEVMAPKSERLITINRRSTEHPDEILCDFSSVGDVQRTAGELTLKLAKGDDVLFFMNAGYMGDDKKVSDIRPEALGSIMYANVFGQLSLVESLVEARHNVKLVGITSAMGSVSKPNTPANYAYAACKAAQNLSTRLLHKQYPEHLDYMLVHPGWVQTKIGGPEAHLTALESAQFIAGALENPANWNRSDGMLKPSTGEIVPW